MRYSLRSTCLLLAAIFIAAAASAQVQSLDPNYTVSLLASGLVLPVGGMIYRPSTNDFLVAQEDSAQIVSVNASTGKIGVFATVPSSACRSGHCVFDLAINSSGDVFATGFTFVGPIVHFDSAGNLIETFPCPSGCQQALAFDSENNLYIPGSALGSGSTAGTTIYEYAAGSTTSPTVFASGFSSLEGIRFNSADQLFVDDGPTGNVYQVTPGGTTSGDHVLWASGLDFPDGIAIDPTTGSVFVGSLDGTVTRATSPGVFSTFSTGLSGAEAIGFDTAGNLYVGDRFVGAVWKFTNGAAVPLQIQPNHGGNVGSVTVRITGQGLESGATVTLTGPGNSIVGTNTTLVSLGILGTTFDLANATPGTYDVLIANPDGTSLTLPTAFTIDQGGGAQISVGILGLNKIRIGSPSVFYANIANTGNSNLYDGIAFLAVPTSYQASIEGVTPTGNAAEGYDANGTRTFPIWLYGLGPGANVSIPIHLQPSDNTSGSGFTLTADGYSSSSVGLSQSGTNSAQSSVLDLLVKAIANATLQQLHDSESQPLTRVHVEDSQSSSSNCPPELDAELGAGTCQELNINVTNAANQLVHDNANPYGYSIGLLGGIVAGAVTELATRNPILALSVTAVVDGALTLYAEYTAGQSLQHAVSSLSGTNVTSLDPNDLIGPPGAKAPRYISTNGALSYAIYYSNEISATAPAQKVTITDQLDTTKYDLSTFNLGPISLGEQTIFPPLFSRDFSTVVDLRPTTDLLVVIKASLDPVTGTVTWILSSLDPATNQPPTGPTVGFLPPGGNGSAFFTLMPKGGLATGAQIEDQATVVFDSNSPIVTPAWSNTLDSTPPMSEISALPGTESSPNFAISWSGKDIGSGIQDFTIYVSDNGAPFTSWLVNTTATSANYSGQNGHSYGFYSVARDLVGNIEPSKTTAEVTTIVMVDTTPPVIIPTITGTPGQNGWYLSVVTVSWSAADPESGIASSTGCTSTTLSTNTAGVTLTCSATNGAGLSNSESVIIKIDQTPPVISGMPPAGCNLWPPDHRLVHVATVSAKDALSGLALFSVSATSNEPSDPNDKDDIEIKGKGVEPREIYLRAIELHHHDHDRDHDKRHHEPEEPKIYTITANDSDLAGNPTTSTATCTVENPRKR